MRRRLKKNKAFIIAALGVGLSAIAQYYILRMMVCRSPREQAFALFIFDLVLVLILDAIKHAINNSSTQPPN